MSAAYAKTYTTKFRAFSVHGAAKPGCHYLIHLLLFRDQRKSLVGLDVRELDFCPVSAALRLRLASGREVYLILGGAS